MIENMIQNLYNIASNSTRNTWWPMPTNPNGIGFGVTVVLLNSRVQSLGFLSTSIPISLEGARCYGASLEVDMAKACMMVLGQ